MCGRGGGGDGGVLPNARLTIFLDRASETPSIPDFLLIWDSRPTMLGKTVAEPAHFGSFSIHFHTQHGVVFVEGQQCFLQAGGRNCKKIVQPQHI